MGPGKKFVDSFVEAITTKYVMVLVSILILTVPLAFYFLNQEHYNHIDIYFDKDDYELTLYRDFQKTYGNEEFVIIVFKDEDLFTDENLELIRRITEKIEKEKGIQKVLSLTNVEEILTIGETITVRTVIPGGRLTREKLDEIRGKALANELIVNAVISKDGKTAGILVEIKPLKEPEKSRVLKKIMAVSEGLAGDMTRLYYGGVPYAEKELNLLSQHDFLVFTPIIFIIVFFVVFFMLKNFILSLLCQFNILLILIWSIGFFVLHGEKFNLVNTIMGGILLAIAVANGIHVLTHYRDELGSSGSPLPALQNSLKHVVFPCFFTSLTTAIGFISFLSGDLRPVKVLGIFTAAGIMIAFILTFTFLPGVITLLRNKINIKDRGNIKRAGDDDTLIKLLLRIGKVATTHYNVIGVVFISILIITIIGIFRIKFETNTLNYLPGSNRIRSDIQFIEDNLSGTIPYVILVRARSYANNFSNRESLQFIEKIQNDLMIEIPSFTTSYSIADYFKTLNRAYNDNREEYYRIPEIESDILDHYELGDYDILNRLVSQDRMETKLSLQLISQTDVEGSKIHRQITNYMKNATGGNFTYEITGLATLYADMEGRLKSSQLKSFSIAFIIIFIMLFFVCRNFKLALVSMIPNIFPITATLGFMGWYGIPLDVVTVMIASITLGIAVDDTIHYVVWFKRNMEKGLDRRASILQAYRDVGKPIVITSFVLFLGFFIFILGSIVPTRIFGVLTAFSMFSALVADLFFLPAIILIIKPGLRVKE